MSDSDAASVTERAESVTSGLALRVATCTFPVVYRPDEGGGGGEPGAKPDRKPLRATKTLTTTSSLSAGDAADLISGPRGRLETRLSPDLSSGSCGWNSSGGWI